MTKRIYIIEPRCDVTEGNTKPVAAGSQGEALREVTKNMFDCRVATTIEVAKLLDIGKSVMGKMDDDEVANQEKEDV